MMESERWQSTTTAEDKKKDDLWADATEVSSVWSSTSQPVILEAVGLDSPIDVVFLRMKIEEVEPSPSSCGLVRYSYGEAVERLLQHMVRELNRQSSVSTGEELFSLGSVWILKSDSNSPIRASILDMERTLDNVDVGITSLRVHWNPRRYPQATQISECIVHENLELGYAIINKPGGVPSHPMVDNGSESALSQYKEKLLRARKQQQSSCEQIIDAYAVLPQRLDTETSGLLVIATQRVFSNYFAKLLEEKSTSTSNGTNNESLSKQYRCLVDISSSEVHQGLERLQQEGSVVTHYVDMSTKAPRTFVLDKPDNLDKPQWKVCHLKINRVRNVYHQIQPPIEAIYQSKNRMLAELEVSLITGRTHQIRGQMAALGCPIVGDDLYNVHTSDISAKEDIENNDDLRAGLALQCFNLRFPEPELPPPGTRSRKKVTYFRSDKMLSYNLQEAWWSQALKAQYKYTSRR